MPGGVLVILDVNVKSQELERVAQALEKLPQVSDLYEVTGEYDIVAVISGMSVTEVNDCIEKIRRVQGIMKTNTMIVLRSW